MTAIPDLEARPYTRPKSKPVFEQIRAHVLDGRFFPGQWLKQAELEELYQASRSEVRAALSSLTERGMVEYVKNRGFRVFNRTDDEIREITEMITVLETAAAAQAVERATAKDLQELRALADNFEELITRASHGEMRMANFRFHARLNMLCGNQLMAQTIQNLRECCVSGPFARYTTYDGLKESSREHYRILEALEQRDAVGLTALIRHHSSHTN